MVQQSAGEKRRFRLIRGHITGTELEKTSKQFIQFATINGTNVTQSVDQVDKIMKAWNVDASQTGNLLGLLTAKAQETGISVDGDEIASRTVSKVDAEMVINKRKGR